MAALGPGARPAVLHAANSAGAIAWPAARYDLVRCGIALYGELPSPAIAEVFAEAAPGESLRPVLSLKAHVAAVRELDAGERPSYGRLRPLPGRSVVATVPLGYADGVPRALFDGGFEVLIGGRRCPLAGMVTMDQIVVDCGPGAPVAPGDEVVLLGRQGDDEITAAEWAGRLGTISYEVLTGIGPRVPRVVSGARHGNGPGVSGASVEVAAPVRWRRDLLVATGGRRGGGRRWVMRPSGPSSRRWQVDDEAMAAAGRAMPGDVEHHFVPVDDGGRIHAVERGSGPPVVLVHGVTLGVAAWVPQLHQLARTHRVVAVDQRGHGQSIAGDGGYSLERLAADLSCVLGALELRGAVVVGHSMGGMVTQLLALDHPEAVAERVAGLVLVATTAGPLLPRRPAPRRPWPWPRGPAAASRCPSAGGGRWCRATMWGPGSPAPPSGATPPRSTSS